MFPATLTRSAIVSIVMLNFFAALLYAFVQPLILIPALLLTTLLLPVARSDVHYIAIRPTQSGGLHESGYLKTLLFVVAASPILLATLMLSRHQWGSSGALFGFSALSLGAAALCAFRSSKSLDVPLDAETQRQISAFLHAGSIDQEEKPASQTKQQKRSSLASLLPGNRRSWASLMDGFSTRPVIQAGGQAAKATFISEVVDANATPLLAARTHEFSAPHLSSEHDPELEARGSLKHPLLVVPQSIVGL